MKSTIKILGIIALVAVIGFGMIACEGPMGPDGLKGDQGQQGDKGDKGDPGTGGGVSCNGTWSVLLPLTVGKPDCTEAGVTVMVCDCGEEHTRIVVAAALGHDFSLWEQTSAPSFLSAGVETEKCSVCNAMGTNTKAGAQLPITSTSQFATVVSEAPANTATTPYTLIVNINDLGGNGGSNGSIGHTLTNNLTKFVNLDMSGSSFSIISEHDFYNTSTGEAALNLINITLPNTVTTIEEYALISTGLTSLTIPASVTGIGRSGINSNSIISVTFAVGSNISEENFGSHQDGDMYMDDLRTKYLAIGGGAGVYTRENATSWTWTKQ